MTPKLLKLTDGNIKDANTISFIFQLLNLFSLHFVEGSIAKNDISLYEHGKEIESIYRAIDDEEEVIFNIDTESLTKLLTAIVDVLIDYQDLHSLTGYSDAEAKDFIASIK